MANHHGGGPNAFDKAPKSKGRMGKEMSVTPSDRYQKRSRNPSGAPAGKRDYDPRDAEMMLQELFGE